MIRMPRISVIVPVYKVEKYIHRCIDSILAQTYRNFELILVDDSSPDTCPEICDEYAKKDDRIRVIHQENGGLSAARNAGIDAANGEFLFFIDSDDVICENTLELLLLSAEKCDADISLGKFQRFSDMDLPDVTTLPEASIKKLSGTDALEMLLSDDEKEYTLISACCKLIRANVLKEIRFPVGRLFEDEFTTYKMYYKSASVVLSDATLYYYYENSTGITMNLDMDKYCDEFDAQCERFNFFVAHGLDTFAEKAALMFLSSARWKLIESRNKSAQITKKNKDKLEREYYDVFLYAKRNGWLDIVRDYDFFVLAEPENILKWRIRRVLTICCRRFFGIADRKNM